MLSIITNKTYSVPKQDAEFGSVNPLQIFCYCYLPNYVLGNKLSNICLLNNLRYYLDIISYCKSTIKLFSGWF